MDEHQPLVGPLGFVIDNGVLSYTDGGCRPANADEQAMWDLLVAHGLVKRDQ